MKVLKCKGCTEMNILLQDKRLLIQKIILRTNTFELEGLRNWTGLGHIGLTTK